MRQLIRVIHRIEDFILWLLLATLIAAGVLQIVLRNFLDTGNLWNEPFTRVLVLWAAMIGAMVATRYDKHIQINLLDQVLSEKGISRLQKLIHFISAGVCFFIAYVATQFVIEEYQYGEIAFGFVKAWFAESIIPIAFTIIGLRFFARVFFIEPLAPESTLSSENKSSPEQV